MNYAQACEICNISYTTFKNWRREGKREVEPFMSFIADIKRAEAIAVREHLGAVTKARDKSWQAAAWWLERKYPELYGPMRHEIAEIKKTIAELQKGQKPC